MEEVKKLLNSKDYEQDFMATDEQRAVDMFRQEFGSLVKVYDDTFRDEGGDESVAFSTAERRNHKYLLGREVLRDQYTLTNCAGLVCGYSNVTFLARIMRKAWYDNNYDDYVLINNGIYHNNNNFWESGHGRNRKRELF